MIKRGGVFPASYWANTSSNSVVRDLVEQIDDEEGELKEELEYLMNGGTIEKPIHDTISGWFEKKKRFELSSLYKAIEEGDTEGME